MTEPVAATFSFRPMEVADLPDLVRWRSQPHVRVWFPEAVADVDAARERYGARIAGEAPVRMWVAQLDRRPLGYLQDYRVRDHDDYAVRVQQPDAVAFDYLIGEPGLVSRGIGTGMVGAFLREVLCRDYPDARHFVASPDHRNAVSLRVLEKLGFTQGLWIQLPGEEYPEIVCTIGRDALERP